MGGINTDKQHNWLNQNPAANGKLDVDRMQRKSYHYHCHGNGEG